MSGGSYEYLCHKSADELLNQQDQLEHMAARLAGLGYAKDAAMETEELICIIRQSLVRIETRAARLSGIWKAVEWWDSCDWGEGRVKEALQKYRGEGEDKEPA